MGTLFSLTYTLYNEKASASYMPSGWYKSIWRYMSNPLYKLEITEDYADLPILRKKDVYIMYPFVDNSFKNTDLKALNFMRKFIQAVTLADITRVNGNHSSHQLFEAIESNGLCKDLWSAKVPD